MGWGWRRRSRGILAEGGAAAATCHHGGGLRTKREREGGGGASSATAPRPWPHQPRASSLCVVQPLLRGQRWPRELLSRACAPDSRRPAPVAPTPPRTPVGRHRASPVPSHGSPTSNMHASLRRSCQRKGGIMNHCIWSASNTIVLQWPTDGYWSWSWSCSLQSAAGRIRGRCADAPTAPTASSWTRAMWAPTRAAKAAPPTTTTRLAPVAPHGWRCHHRALHHRSDRHELLRGCDS